jgi:hypothetical protein
LNKQKGLSSRCIQGDFPVQGVPHEDARSLLRGALGAFGVESEYFVALGANGSPWWHIEPEDPINWLAMLAQSRDDGAPTGHGYSPIRSRQGDGLEDLTVLSSDGARVLLLETHEDRILTFRLPTRSMAEGRMLLDLVKELDPVANTVPSDPRERLRYYSLGVAASGFRSIGVPIDAGAMHPGPRCRRRWSWDAATGERSSFFLEGLATIDASAAEHWNEIWARYSALRQNCLERLESMDANALERQYFVLSLESLDASPPVRSVPPRYLVSAGRSGPLTWTMMAKANPPPDWIATLWDRGHLDRLFVATPPAEVVLGFLATATGIEGFLYDIDEVRSA